MNFSVQLMSQIKTEACQHNGCVNSSICPTSRNKPFLKVAGSGVHSRLINLAVHPVPSTCPNQPPAAGPLPLPTHSCGSCGAASTSLRCSGAGRHPSRCCSSGTPGLGGGSGSGADLLNVSGAPGFCLHTSFSNMRVRLRPVRQPTAASTQSFPSDVQPSAPKLPIPHL